MVTLPQLFAQQLVMMINKQGRIASERMFWLKLKDKETSRHWKQFTEWIMYMRPDCYGARHPWHCTVKYDDGDIEEEYKSL